MVPEPVLQNTSNIEMVTIGSSSSTASPAMNSLAQSVSEKLSSENFILWKAQVLGVVRGVRLYGYLDGTIKVPTKEIHVQLQDNTRKTEENPAYTAWYAQDQQLLSFLLNSVTKEVLAQVATESSSSGAWNAILGMFSSQS
jgi:hypothetical protein